ncbi:peptidase A4 family-domain-containing protein [Lophiotrema nucula]|uniref:Peptidase A4 family-domain-containing protein n=1 Tax=Lophiotrema nucula TaxID=690887 RepID=A0A6A5YUW4_9PLEO|nr:peptidase A4 family-domain-containing protein [Lophiotrema nucula]
MKLLPLFGCLLASTVVAAPGSPSRQERAAERFNRRAALRNSNPLQAASLEELRIATANTSHVQYSSNWAGAVLIGSGYKSVTGTITVPTPKVPSGGSSRTQYAASAWVGIDGDTCASAILQTGVDFYVQGTTVSFDAWYEWYPDYAYDFTGITVKAGDQIKMTVTASSTSGGSAVIQNLSTGKTVTKTFSGESNKLCETNAEWIVEDFSSSGGLVPFANFGTVTFSGASVTTTSSSTLGVSGAQILDIQQNNKVLTSCSTSGTSTVTCSYTG